jgi:hypothetical protein
VDGDLERERRKRLRRVCLAGDELVGVVGNVSFNFGTSSGEGR